MNKYFNTEILRMLVAHAPDNVQDIANDRYVAMDAAGQYLVYVSSNPKKGVSPRNVKKCLRKLFRGETKPHRCIVRIQDDYLPKFNQLKAEKEEEEKEEQEEKWEMEEEEKEEKWEMEEEVEEKEKEKEKKEKKKEKKEKEKQKQKQKQKEKEKQKQKQKQKQKSTDLPPESTPKKDSVMEHCEDLWVTMRNDISVKGNFMDIESKSSVVTPKPEERARGGLNITFDPYKLCQKDTRTNLPSNTNSLITTLHRNLKSVSSSSTTKDGEICTSMATLDGSFNEDKQLTKIEMDNHDTTQSMYQLTTLRDLCERLRDPRHQTPNDMDMEMLLNQPLQLYLERLENLKQYLTALVDLHVKMENEDKARIYQAWYKDLSDTEEELIERLSRNSVNGCTNSTPNLSSERLEQFRGGLAFCLRSIGKFFTTGEQESSNTDILYVDRENSAPLVLGPSIDEPITLLVDRIIFAVNWALKKEKSPSENKRRENIRNSRPQERREGYIEVKLPSSDTSEMETEKEQQHRRKKRSRSLTRAITSLNIIESNRKGRQ